MYDLTSLSPTELENLSFDLLNELGLTNCVWRTPGSDVGRDIEGEYFFSDVSGYFQKQKWYVECKRYTSSVDWPTVWNKISYAEAHDADVLLFLVTSSLSPQATDQVNIWNRGNKKPLIRVLSGADISSKLRIFPHLSIKYGFSEATDANISFSIFPLVELLLKTIYSLSSGLAMGVDITSSAELSQALTDLISVRINDLKNKRGICAYAFINNEDGYEWANNSNCIENTELYRYGVRAVLSYINLQSKAPPITLTKESENSVSISECSVEEKNKEQLQMISCWSNFKVLFTDDDKIILEC